jgi:hypothetical protein
MFRRWVSALALPLSLGGTLALSQTDRPKLTAVVPGTSLRWLEIATSETRRKHLNPNNFNVSVIEANGLAVVIFKSANAPEKTKGNGLSRIGYEVQIRESDAKIVHSNFLR